MINVFLLSPYMVRLSPNGKEQQLSLLVALAEYVFDPVDALTELPRDVALRLLHVLDERALARADAVAKMVDEDGGAAAGLGGREGKDVVGGNRKHGI